MGNNKTEEPGSRLLVQYSIKSKMCAILLPKTGLLVQYSIKSKMCAVLLPKTGLLTQYSIDHKMCAPLLQKTQFSVKNKMYVWSCQKQDVCHLTAEDPVLNRKQDYVPLLLKIDLLVQSSIENKTCVILLQKAQYSNRKQDVYHLTAEDPVFK